MSFLSKRRPHLFMYLKPMFFLSLMSLKQQSALCLSVEKTPHLFMYLKNMLPFVSYVLNTKNKANFTAHLTL